jgi:glycosyltransferase involved in cell wall biosynthesis
LQTNHSHKISRVFLAVEKYLAKKENLFMCTSASEAKLVTDLLMPKNTVKIVVNGIDHEIVSAEPRAFPKSRFRIAMVGRITYQKAPWVFNEIAAVCREIADFKWIGSEPGVPIKWLDEQNIEVLPWCKKDELIKELENVDLLVHPTLWEGFPLTVALAQGSGIPVLVSDVVGNRDAISPEHSGYVCNTVSDYEFQIKQIIASESLYGYLSNCSITYAREFLSNQNLGTQSIGIYEEYSCHKD